MPYPVRCAKVGLGDGSGGFVAASGSPLAVSDTSLSVPRVGDIDDDGNVDVVVSCGTPGNRVRYFLSDGTGALTEAPGSPIASGGTSPKVPAVGDVNNDGYDDVFVTNYSSNNLQLHLSNP